MKRDMDLIRLSLLKIEEEYSSTAIYDLQIDGYDMETIAYHCKLLKEAGFISDYAAEYGDGEICSFGVGSLTWEGHEYLEKIRDNSTWKKVKDTISQKGLPLAIETIKTVSTALITAATDAVVKSIMSNAGL